MKIISSGWGTQSVTLCTMIVEGDLEPVDYVVHADTTHEASGTYDYRARWEDYFTSRGLKFITLTPPDTKLINKFGGVRVPAYTLSANGKGMIKRQCTDDWKRDVIRRWLQQHRANAVVEQWLGISLDEWTRMKDSHVKYIVHRWPLIEKRMTRYDCVQYLQEHKIEIPPKSACVFCPYRKDTEFRAIRDVDTDYQRAMDADEAIRYARPPEQLFIHRSCKPLVDVNLATPEEEGQISLFDDMPCDSGYCFV